MVGVGLNLFRSKLDSSFFIVNRVALQKAILYGVVEMGVNGYVREMQEKAIMTFLLILVSTLSIPKCMMILKHVLHWIR